ncbi:NAD(P)/FAD-dependent oxidoreductase [Dinghuibacter silviterrae]|uniref:Protoporphyrinogen oxidase n=1 Tax=Dinghuibacter silviterrae TaxID=1539049 RepID=A0A4R8DTL0_9BACT|nr:NAD(P)/FAD-dependent oxidoreductase [Dinghuibacter silviterrae]TDX00471.1 protoporphyrinogen oxidase [Dinghuibacter silviterrae]
MRKIAIIIGAGPAGLTAAYELLTRSGILPVILEMSGDMGGISKTVNYKGNRIDFGGHRFFSKSDRVMEWWLNIMPMEDDGNTEISYHGQKRPVNQQKEITSDADPNKVMLLRRRISRIYFLRRFFRYPMQLSLDTLRKLGMWRTVMILLSYLKAWLFPRRPERNLEDFFINRFGKTLYQLFFRDYTEKVWGVSCRKIPPEWGAQRIKGVSVSKAVAHALRSITGKNGKGIAQKGTETSLIERFLYPKWGPGQLWEEVARLIVEKGGVIHTYKQVDRIFGADGLVQAVETIDPRDGKREFFEGDYFFSTMPIKNLVAGMDGLAPAEVREVAQGLKYRDFITVGVLLQKMAVQNPLKDTWIYIQEPGMRVGRIQLFHNWSPFMVKDPGTIWLGMEYFCTTGNDLWSLKDEELLELAMRELGQMGLANSEDVLDGCVLRMEKTYPAYFGTYDQFPVLRSFLDGWENLFPIGRNGMHKYNNSDHSMLTAMVSVDNIVAGVTDKTNIWAVNTEQEYHEEVKEKEKGATAPEAVTGAVVEDSGGFGAFVFRQNRKVVWWSAIILLLEFIFFKTLYPFANFIFDSHIYIDSAERGLAINVWPTGYSKFLSLIHFFSHSDMVLVFVQYLLLEATALYLYFTILYFLQPGRWSKSIILFFILCNPAFLSISNYVLSDALFLSLSLVWFAQLIWLIYRPKWATIIFNAVILLLLFTIRYQALYYPLITIVVMWICRMPIRVRLAGIFFTVLLLGLFINSQMRAYKAISGKAQFSAFSGWQLASNAMLMYRHLPGEPDDEMPGKFKPLHRLVVSTLDSFNRTIYRPDSAAQIFYLWDKGSPLIKYFRAGFRLNQNPNSFFTSWAAIAPLYQEYGLYLIKKHPAAYLQYFVGQNLIWYAEPATEFLGVYDHGTDSVSELEQRWFGYESKQIQSSSNRILYIDDIYPALSAIIKMAFIVGAIGFLFFGGIKQSPATYRLLLMIVGLFWTLDLGFSLLASPVVLRYQLFQLSVEVIFGTMFLEYIFRLEDKKVARLETGKGGIILQQG